MNPELEQVGSQIKSRRKQQGWSQEYLANISGLNRTTIGAIERGDYTDIGIRKVARVLQLLGFKITLSDQFLPTLDEVITQQQIKANKALANEQPLSAKDAEQIITGCNYL